MQWVNPHLKFELKFAIAKGLSKITSSRIFLCQTVLKGSKHSTMWLVLVNFLLNFTEKRNDHTYVLDFFTTFRSTTCFEPRNIHFWACRWFSFSILVVKLNGNLLYTAHWNPPRWIYSQWSSTLGYNCSFFHWMVRLVRRYIPISQLTCILNVWERICVWTDSPFSTRIKGSNPQ